VTRWAGDVMVEPRAISALTTQAMDFLDAAGVDAGCSHRVGLILDEILTNLATHGGGAATSASVLLEIQDERVRAEIVDCGAPFDPRTAVAPDTRMSAEERPLGGLGLMLVHRVACGLGYERRGDRNWTAFAVARATPAAQGK
jgi:serine/threonine-protein kinase RsbW